jgi:hypothetical protein
VRAVELHRASVDVVRVFWRCSAMPASRAPKPKPCARPGWSATTSC